MSEQDKSPTTLEQLYARKERLERELRHTENLIAREEWAQGGPHEKPLGRRGWVRGLPPISGAAVAVGTGAKANMATGVTLVAIGSLIAALVFGDGVPDGGVGGQMAAPPPAEQPLRDPTLPPGEDRDSDSRRVPPPPEPPNGSIETGLTQAGEETSPVSLPSEPENSSEISDAPPGMPPSGGDTGNGRTALPPPEPPPDTVDPGDPPVIDEPDPPPPNPCLVRVDLRPAAPVDVCVPKLA